MQGFRPVATRRAFEEITAQIRGQLARHTLRTGDRLPAERQLAEQFHVSRNTLREALRSLEIAGLLELRKGATGGAFIKEGGGAAAVAGLADLYHLGTIKPQHLTEARIVIGTEVARLACARRSKEDLGALEANVAAAEAATIEGDVVNRARINYEFHRLLARAARNPGADHPHRRADGDDAPFRGKRRLHAEPLRDAVAAAAARLPARGRTARRRRRRWKACSSACSASISRPTGRGNDGQTSAGALQGIRVLDFSAMIAGPYCTRLMADLGADVIKVEPPEGDYMRSRAPLREGRSVYFGVVNAGKRSMAVDLKKPAGAALVKDLAAASDVVVENFRPGVMQRLGFDYAALSAANPRLVYCSISGYGQEGAHARLPAYAPIVQAASGFDVTAMSHQRAERPPNSAIFIADYLTGVHAFGASCAALVRRERSGKGEYIDCALMDSMLGMLAYEVAEAQEPVSRPRPLYQATRAKDGFLMVAPISQGNFEDMARAMGREDLQGRRALRDGRRAQRAIGTR